MTAQTRFATTFSCRSMRTASCCGLPHPHSAHPKCTSRASRSPGVYLVMTGRTFAIQYGDFRQSDEQALCVDRVRHVESVAPSSAREEADCF